MTTELIAWHMHQLQKHTEYLEAIRERVIAARFTSIHKLERHFHVNIKSHNFQPGTYVLVCNSKVEYELSKKMKPCYLRPMVVVHCMKGGSYMLAELDSAISKHQFTTFCIIPYYPCCDEHVSVTEMMGVDDESIDEMEASETIEPEEDDPEGTLYIFSPHFNPIAIYFIHTCPHNTHNSPIIHHLTAICLMSLSICV
jgi:hypothetical protein